MSLARIKTFFSGLFKKKDTPEVINITAITTIPNAVVQNKTPEKQKENIVSTTVDSAKDKLIAMLIPVLLKVAQDQIPKLLAKYLPPEKIDEFLLTGLDSLKAKIKESKTEWDDILILPFINYAEEVFGLSAAGNVDSPGETTEDALTTTIAANVIASVLT